MDPDTCLAGIRDRIHDITARFDTGALWSESAEDIALLIEHVEALDDWLCRGGFLPREWNYYRNPVL
jgi:hypothetical protein